MPDLDLRAYLVTGAGTPEHIAAVARAAALGGAGMIQLRSKPIAARDLFALGRVVAEAIADTPAKLLIDDRVDVALALRRAGVRVDGVHVGQDDLPVAAVRDLLGPAAIIGLTTGTRALIEQANKVAHLIDYVGAGPFRPTPTKDSGRAPIGLAGYPELVAASKVPVVAIGDVTDADAAALAATGVAGVAIVRGFMTAADPAAYARRVVAAFAGGRREGEVRGGVD